MAAGPIHPEEPADPAVASASPDQSVEEAPPATSADSGAGRTAPWYRQASILISIVALLFSAAASWYASNQSARQYQFSARAELGQLVQRLSALPKENEDLLARYRGDPGRATELSGLINQENLVLAHQAADVIDQIPDQVSAVECLAVATALATSEQYPRSLSLIEGGLERADDPTTREALLRLEGQIHFTTGQPTLGRAALQEALGAWPDEPVWEQARGYALTEVLWAGLEQSAGTCREAVAHLSRAREQAARLDPASGIGRQVADAVGSASIPCR